jgi:F-type H+-transporting ATPase subunit b
MDIHQILLAASEVIQQAAETGAQVSEAAAETHEADPGLLGTLGINWKLFIAQLVNFGIVLFIFWKWIVKPLGKTLTERQERIESGLKNADYMEQEKKNFEDWRQAEMKKARGEAENIIKATTETANKMKQDIVSEAHLQSAKMMEQTKAQIESEKSQMLKEVKQEVATLVVSASEKILRTKIDSKKDQELVSESIKSIK